MNPRPNWKSTVRQRLTALCLLVLGTLVSDLGIVGFLVPNQFIDGGVTGICMLLANFAGLPLAAWITLINLPFIYLGFRHVGSWFAIKTALAILLLSLWLLVIPFPQMTHDKLLGAVFGGVFAGAGVGLAIRGGGVLDGTEILALVLSKRTAATVGEWILILNVLIFLIAALVIGVEPALYSVLTYFAAYKTIDYLMHGIEAYHGVLIVSPNNQAIQQSIISEMGRGVTILKSVGGYTAKDQQVLYCIVTRLEIPKLQSIVESLDPSAFQVIAPVHDVIGGVVKNATFPNRPGEVEAAAVPNSWLN